jgi:hypothetical protein
MIGEILTRIVAYVFSAGCAVAIELNLFILTLALPFWLIPSTERAFYGVLRSLVAFTVAVPAYQFIMLFVDGLMSLTLRLIMFGSLGVPGASVGQAASGVAYTVSAAIVAMSSPEFVACVLFGYLIAYIFLAIYAALKTPKLITLFLQGAGAVGGFVSMMATGAVVGLVGFAMAASGSPALARRGLSFARSRRDAGGGSLGGAQTTADFLPGGPGPQSGGGNRFGTAGSQTPPASHPQLGRVVSREYSEGTPRPSGAAPVASQPPAVAPAAAVPRPSDRRDVAEGLGLGLQISARTLRTDSPSEAMDAAIQTLKAHADAKERQEEQAYRRNMRQAALAKASRGQAASPQAQPLD